MSNSINLPEGDEDVIHGCEPHAGVYDIDRLNGQTLDEIRAFVDAASALHGGGSRLHLQIEKARIGQAGYGFIDLELEADIKAVEAARAKLTPEDRKLLGVK